MILGGVGGGKIELLPAQEALDSEGWIQFYNWLGAIEEFQANEWHNQHFKWDK